MSSVDGEKHGKSRKALAGFTGVALIASSLVAAAGVTTASAAPTTDYVPGSQIKYDANEDAVYQDWHFGPGSNRAEVIGSQQLNGVVLQQGKDAQILKGNSNFSDFGSYGVSITDLANSLTLNSTDQQAITFQILVRVDADGDGTWSPGEPWTTLRRPVLGGPDSWARSKGSFAAGRENVTLDALVTELDNLGTALPTGAGFLASATQYPAHVSSFSANGVTTNFFAPETTSVSLPELNYVNQHFNEFTWVRDRQVPSVFDAQANELNVEVDRAAVNTSGSGTFYRWEGKKTDLTTVPGIANVLSIKADLYVDPAWRDLPATNGRKYNFGLWFTVPYPDTSYPIAWPDIEVYNDAAGNPVASIFDTLGETTNPPKVPLAYGETVTLEIRYDRLSHSLYYFVNSTLVFSHEWPDAENSGHPFKDVIFQAWNTGQAGVGTPDIVKAKWSNLRFGTAIPLASVTGDSDFGVQAANTIGAARTFTVTNTGTAVLEVSRVRVVDTDDVSADDFLITTDNASGESLQPGQSAKVKIRFAPSRQNATSNASLVVKSNIAGGQTVVALTGTSTDLPKGDQGDTGATGPQGPAGDTGATGDKGDAGDSGTAGQDGRDGLDIAPAALLKPSFTSATMTVQVGSQLTAQQGVWWPVDGVSVSLQWLRNGQPIPGATRVTYTPTVKDLSARISVRATAQRVGHAPAVSISDAKRVAKGTLTAKTPKIQGKSIAGKKLKVKSGKWKHGTVKLTYAWFANGVKIKKAKKKTYKVKAKDAGKQITVRVTGSRPGYTKASAFSLATTIAS